MKTNFIQKSLRFAVIAFFFLLTANSLNAQFIGSDQTDQTPVEERKATSSNYTVPGPAADQYSWQVVGGTITSPAGVATGDGSVGDPWVLPFTVGLQQITVQWPADDATITSVSGNVSVQRQVVHTTVNCPSVIQSLDVDLWSAATATLTDADYEICSGDATLGDITVQFTGAPNFDFKYTITDLDGTTGAEQVVTGISGASATIAIPANLVNTSSTDDQTYIVTITEMNDSFVGLGTVVDATFTITVHPTVETGDIVSSGALLRR